MMRRLERRWRRVGMTVLAMTLAGGAIVAAIDETTFRYRAPIEVRRSGAFVLLPLSAEVYARSARAGLDDLRVVDARGERVPFALLAPRLGEVRTTELLRATTIYPLPARPSADGTWTSPVELTIEGDRISVKRRGGSPRADAAGQQRSGGWLIDLGERKRPDPVPTMLQVEWSGPAEFSALFSFETSDDLRRWRAGGSGQLMALSSAAGTLTQPRIVLPTDPARFVRLVWADPNAAPIVVGAHAMIPEERSVTLDPPTELTIAPGPAPIEKTPETDKAPRALHFDLGGALPLVRIDLQLPPGTHVAPVRIDGRTASEQEWRALGANVFYRLERDGVVSQSAPVPVNGTARYVRVVPDERAAALDAARTRLVVHAQLARIVFAAQGQAPYALLAGSSKAAPGALPATTLVPALEEERARFGAAVLGEWGEVAAAVQQAQAEARRATLRVVLLWTVLVGGVGALAFMVWRLARAGGGRPA